MKAAEFTRRRVRAENEYRGKSRHYKSALRHLIQRAGAIIVVANNKVIGYRLPDGSVSCLKRRYLTIVDAELDLVRIKQKANHGHIPVRAYVCQWCHGIHLTSRA